MAYSLAIITIVLLLILGLGLWGSHAGPESDHASLAQDGPIAAENSRIRQVTIESEHTSPAATQAMHVTLHNPQAELMILTLSITYPDGEEQTVIESSLANIGTLTWTIPSTVISGIATYRLSAGGCGCGMSSHGLNQSSLESTAEGTFWVE